MAVSATLLTLDRGTGGGPYSTASVTPGANRLVLLVFQASGPGGTPDPSSVTGNGLTWVKILRQGFGNGDGLWIYRTMGAAPTSGAITMDFSPSTDVSNIVWSVVEFQQVDTSGTNGSGAVVQSVGTNHVSTSTPSVTLAAFSSPDNATFGAFAGDSGVTATPGSGFTQVGDSRESLGAGNALFTEFRSDNDTTVDATWSSAVGTGVVGVEVKAGSGGSASGAGLLIARL